MKKILSLLLVVLIALSTVVMGGAHYDIPNNMTLEEASKDPKYWHQGSCPEGNFPITPGNSTVGEAACSWFSSCFLFVKMGLMDPKKENPVTLIKWAQEKPGSRVWCGFHIDYTGIKEKYTTMEVSYNDDIAGVRDYDKIKLYCKGKMNEGWFVGLCVGQPSGGAHWVAVDGFDKDGDIILADSAYAGWNEPKKYNAPGNYGPNGGYADNAVCHVELYKVAGANPLKCPSIYGGTFEGGDDMKLTSVEQEEFDSICEEGALKGMPDVSNTSMLNQATQLEFADRRLLSQEKITQIENINDLHEADKITPVQVVSISLRIIGILLILYSVVLFMCLMFDKVNNMFDFSLLSLVSFGTLKVNDERDINSDLKKKNHKSTWAICTIIGIVFILGLIFLSDIVLKVIYSVL